MLLGLMLISLFFGYRASKLRFDYEFENFFPEGNESLSFFKAYRNAFESDNDFILISLVNKGGIFQQNFLDKVVQFTDSLRELPHIRTVVSPLEAVYYDFGPSALGNRKKRFFHPENPATYKADSLRLGMTKLPIQALVSIEHQSLLLIVNNEQMISKKKSDELANALNALMKRQDFDELRSMGKILGQKVYVSVLQKEFVTFMGISILLLIVFLLIAYRSLWGVLIPIATVLLAVIGSLGFMQLNGSQLNMITTLLPVIMLVVGMSDVVHLVSKYLEEIRSGNNKIDAIKMMIKKVGMATLLTSLTTALGFFTLVAINITPIKTFGLYTAIGVLLAFVLSILFIPAIFILIKTPKIAKVKQSQTAWDRVLAKLYLLLCRNRKTVLGVYALLTIISIYGASKVRFDYYLMQDLSESHELMQDLRYFQKYHGGIRPFEMAIIPKGDYKISDYKVIREVEKLTNFLDTAYGVHQLLAPSTPYKFINYLMRNSSEDYFRIPTNEKRYNYIKRQLTQFSDREEWSSLVNEKQNLGRVYGRMNDPGSATILKRNEMLENFYRENIDAEMLSYKLTGSAAMVDESSRIVSRSILYGLLSAFLLIAIAMGFLFRSAKMALLSLIPNLFPILLTAGIIGFANIQLSMTTAIVFTIAFGIAVDDTIHFLSRYRQEMRFGRSRLFALRRTYISTGKAMIITTIILLGGFGSLLFSSFLSTFYIGLFVSLTLIFALITDMVLLPVLLLGSEKDQSKTTI